MKVKVNEVARSKTNYGTIELIPNKVYTVIKKEPFLGSIWYRIVDESSEDYLYPPSLFDIVEE